MNQATFREKFFKQLGLNETKTLHRAICFKRRQKMKTDKKSIIALAQ